MSWQVYVDLHHLLCDIEGSHLTHAAIIGQDGSVWAQSANFPQFKPEEITTIMNDFNEPGSLAPTGLYLGGTKYIVFWIDYQDRAKRKDEKTLEVVWRGRKSLGSSSQDDVSLFDYNVPQRVNKFVAAAISQANITRTNHIMWTMGIDFKYQYAQTWFCKLDKFTHYVNQQRQPCEYVAFCMYAVFSSCKSSNSVKAIFPAFIAKCRGIQPSLSACFTAPLTCLFFTRSLVITVSVQRRHGEAAPSSENFI